MRRYSKHEPGKGKGSEKKLVLGDHKRAGKVFMPPFVAALKDSPLAYVSWTDDLLPEVLWLGLLREQVSEKRAIEAALALVTAASKVLGPKQPWPYVFIDDYQGMTFEDAEPIKAALAEAGEWDTLNGCLRPLVCLYPECPLAPLLEPIQEDDAAIQHGSLELLRHVVFEYFDRHARPAAIIQTTVLYLMGRSGKMFFANGCGPASLDPIFMYPDTLESRRVASFSRSAQNAFAGQLRGRSKWNAYFWRRGHSVTPCRFKEGETSLADVDSLVESRSDPDLDQAIENRKAWLEAQMRPEFLSVNVGNWSEKNIRDMASEVGRSDLHALMYTPLSSLVHGTWNTISRLNLRHCSEPLHKFHLVPDLDTPPLDIGILESALSLMEDSFRTWEESLGVPKIEVSATVRFMSWLGDSVHGET